MQPIQNILEDFEKSLKSKMEIFTAHLESLPTPILCKNLIFWHRTFFQSLLEFFLWVVYTCSRYLKGPINLDHYNSEKIRSVRCIKQIKCKEKSKKLNFWKFQYQNAVGEISRYLKYVVKTLFFDSKLFFKVF